jgi:hypothetical protein
MAESGLRHGVRPDRVDALVPAGAVGETGDQSITESHAAFVPRAPSVVRSAEERTRSPEFFDGIDRAAAGDGESAT